jgi:outer membrane protein OmpA-like peptidoglycan-associated protein
MDRAQREAAERATREQAAQVEQLARAKEQLDESQRKMDAQQQQLQLRQQELDQARRDREQAEAARKEALAELERVAKVSEEQRGTVITLPGGLLFAPGQTVLSGDAQRALGQVAEALKAVPDQRVVIEGHTDSKGTEDANYELSILRANAVKDFLSSRGVERERVETVGYGESRPVASNTTAEGRATNRRVEIVVQRGVGGSGPGLLRKP